MYSDPNDAIQYFVLVFAGGGFVSVVVVEVVVVGVGVGVLVAVLVLVLVLVECPISNGLLPGPALFVVVEEIVGWSAPGVPAGTRFTGAIRCDVPYQYPPKPAPPTRSTRIKKSIKAPSIFGPFFCGWPAVTS